MGDRCRVFVNGTSETRASIALDTINRARAHLLLPNATHLTAQQQFFVQLPGAEVTGCEGDTLFYKDVWKGANNFFQFSMEQKCGGRPNRDPRAAPVFSFVRDPMERFASAYREVLYRTKRGKCTMGHDVNSFLPCDLLESSNLSSSYTLAELTLHALIEGSPMDEGKHFSLMAAFLFTRPPYPTWIGRLACIEEDYNNMCAALSCPAAIDDYSKMIILDGGGHADSSRDPFRYEAGLHRYLLQHPRWNEALRILYELDVDCFRIKDDACVLYPPSPPPLSPPSPPPPPLLPPSPPPSSPQMHVRYTMDVRLAAVALVASLGPLVCLRGTLMYAYEPLNAQAP